MNHYFYLKAAPKKRKKKPAVLIAVFFAGGLVFLANAILPILNYQLKARGAFEKELIVPTSQFGPTTPKKNVVVETTDFRQPSQWFTQPPELPPLPSKITHYTLSIPKLGIENALVEIGGQDLMKSMIHYPGTALPGRDGNTAIFCHSSLPQLFNSEDYKTICSTLPSLEERDEILVDFDGIQYRYRVTQMVEVGPEDISVLAQRQNSRYLSLITCVPPGTYWRRLVVKAELV